MLTSESLGITDVDVVELDRGFCLGLALMIGDERMALIQFDCIVQGDDGHPKIHNAFVMSKADMRKILESSGVEVKAPGVKRLQECQFQTRALAGDDPFGIMIKVSDQNWMLTSKIALEKIKNTLGW